MSSLEVVYSAAAARLYTTLLLPILLFCTSTALAEHTLRFCADSAQKPPYAYGDTAKKTFNQPINGASIDFLSQISKASGIPITVEFMPWKRCILEVLHYNEKKRYEAFLDGTLNQDRLASFYVTTPLYRTHLGVFYAKQRFPKGIPSTIEELNHYSLCGILGYNYDHFIKAGIKKEIHTSARDLPQAFQRLMSRRCDILLTSVAVTEKLHKVGPLDIPPTLQYTALPSLEKPTHHLFISKQSPRAEKVLTLLNQAILHLQHSGEAQKTFEQYFPLSGDGLQN